MGGRLLSEVRILGELELIAEDGEALRLPTGRARDALVVLAVNCGRPVRFRELMGCFDDSTICDEENAREVADGWLDALQEQLPGPRFERTSVSVTLRSARGTVDALRFIDSASRCCTSSDAVSAMRCWRSDPARTHRHLLPHVWAPVYQARDRLLSRLSGWDDQALIELECLRDFLAGALDRGHPMRSDIELRLRHFAAAVSRVAAAEHSPSPVPTGSSTTAGPSAPASRTLDGELLCRNQTRLTWDEVSAGIEFIAAAARDWLPDRVIGINRGGAIVGGMLAKVLGIRHIGIIELVVQGSALRAVDRPSSDDRFKRVLVVDEANRSGRHLDCAKQELADIYPAAEIRAAALVDVAYVDHDEGLRPLDMVPYVTTIGTVRFPWDPD